MTRDDPSTQERPAPVVQSIDPDAFTPRLVVLLANALGWRESSIMRRRFGLGTNDWRVLSTLALRSGASASEVAAYVCVSKAMVSKSVRVLVDRGLVTLSEGPRGSRPMHLTAAGIEMHDAMLPVSLEFERTLLDGLAPDEVASLRRMLRQMLAGVAATNAAELSTTTSDPGR